MVKAFAIFGCVVAICLSQGCGGKKADIASAPPADTSGPGMGGQSAELSDMPGSGSGANNSSSDLASMNGGPNMGKVGMGPGASGFEGDSSNNGSGGMSPLGSSGGYSPNGGSGDSSFGNAGFDNIPQPGFDPNNSMPGQQNQNRPRPKPLPPPTLKEQAIKAFQAGNAKRAYTLLQAHALQLPDDEAAEILKDYRWASHRKRPQLGVNIAVGVTLKNPLNATDLSPIGTENKNQGGGGGGGGGVLGFGASSGMGGADGAPDPTKSKSLSDTTGVLSTRLAQVFKERHEKGVWAPAFQDYWLVTAREGGFGAMAGGGFNEGTGDFGNNGGVFGNNGGGFGNSGSGFGNGAGVLGAGNGGFGNSGEAINNSGGGQMPSSDQGNGPTGNVPGLAPTGKGSSGMADPSGLGTPKGGGAKIPSEQDAGGGGAAQSGVSGAPFKFLQGGRPGMFGEGRGPGGDMPPAFGNNAMLPAGSTPIAPCLTFIGVDESTKLMKKAVQDGYDALMIFEVTIGVNRVIQRVTNDTLVRVVQPSIVPKDVKKIYVSKVLNNLQVERSKSKGESDGVDEAMEKIIKSTEEAIGLESIPTILTPELIATKRVPALIKETETSVIDRLSEVNLYFSKGYLDETQKADAFEKIAGQAGRVIATGSPTEKLAEVQKLVDREFK